MTKEDLINSIASDTKLPTSTVAKVLASYQNRIVSTLKKGGEVKLIGFGKFTSSKRAEHPGRDPRTGAPITIKAMKRAKFMVSPTLHKAIA